jgi:hypothetical protein
MVPFCGDYEGSHSSKAIAFIKPECSRSFNMEAKTYLLERTLKEAAKVLKDKQPLDNSLNFTLKVKKWIN